MAMSPNQIRDELAEGLIAQGMDRDEAIRYATDKTSGSANDPAADLRAARERLGTFLAAEYGRFALIVEVKAPPGVQIAICRFNRDGSNDGRDVLGFAFCTTEAAAILAALEKAVA